MVERSNRGCEKCRKRGQKEFVHGVKNEKNECFQSLALGMIRKNHRNELDSLPDLLPTIAEPKQVEIDSSDTVLTRADLAWSISGWRMTDEGHYGWSRVHRIGCLSNELRGSMVKGAQDWNDFGEGRSSVLQGRDENLFEVEFRNDLMDSPPAVDWKVLMVVVAVRVDDRTNDWVKLMRAMAMVIDRYQCWDCHSPLSSTVNLRGRDLNAEGATNAWAGWKLVGTGGGVEENRTKVDNCRADKARRQAIGRRIRKLWEGKRQAGGLREDSGRDGKGSGGKDSLGSEKHHAEGAERGSIRDRRRTDIGYISKAVVERRLDRTVGPVGLWHWAVELGRRARQQHTVVRSSYHFRPGTKVNSTAGWDSGLID
ncbi:hypothetical protein PPACK8108_LOCUS4561 [Phakopsora pachyrhizi]|uniref:Uncharacterized protein n=1 Tax=Phakopsora pachyrhizi TaxID=170000 RepID=A0AAV0ANL6_PHAPC|nr:hypothetical protein PPACK8108_LOCUS4561 [Phakopsora pachyrhizi]